ncbi:hypothetical protein SAMN04488564_101982 [Lentzea waywayandensis]|uniref:PLL-like beta propeller domain-containing protein n=2 Tax=Lentzea waywayandensis TaxID=84724 RepID=A0A1I6D3T2_9PSEU|nr:hypothetical protein SAMN04488564_101982 [Lentzea waywayandensis]
MRSGLAAVLVAGVVGTVVPVVGAQVAHADAAGKGGDYVPVSSSPVVLDTRSGIGATGERGEASTTTFTVTGGAVPTTGVGSVVMRITLLNPTEATWAVAWPDGQTRPGTTMISAGVGEDISNIAVVKLGPQGKVSVYNAAGKTHMVAEVQGYFTGAQGATGGGFVPVAHTRVIDTRSGTGTTTGTIPAGGSRTVTLTGGVIPAGAGAAMVNLLVPGAATAGWVSAGPGTSVNRAVFNYEAGSTQSGAVLALSDGKVTFRNNGPDPINLVVLAEGYFGTASNQGAGWRDLTKRLINTRTAGNGQPLAANASLDVQVGGISGMATQAVEGAVVNIVVTPEAAGYLKAWAGPTEPAVTVMDFKANIWRGNMITLKPGADGKIHIRNGSSKPAHVIVDLQGWFAGPVPTVPIEQDSKMSMLMAAPVDGATAGKLHHAYVDDGGDVRWGRQDNVDVENDVQWTVLSDGQSFTGQPAITQLPTGQVRIFALRPNGAVWSRTQTAVGTTTWDPWVDLGGSMAAPPEVAKLGNGTVVLFASDSAGKLWAYSHSGSVPFWRDLGDKHLAPGTVRAVEVQGGVRVFGVTATGSVETIQYYDDGGVSGWTALGGENVTGKPAVVLRPGFVPQLFVRGAAGVIQTKLQDQSGAWPTDWQTIGAAVAAGAPAAVKDPGTSRIAVVYRGTDNEIYRFFETSTGSNTWGDPELIAGTGNSDQASSDPTTMTFINSNGQTFMVGFISNNGVPRFYSRK